MNPWTDRPGRPMGGVMAEYLYVIAMFAIALGLGVLIGVMLR